MFFVLSDCIICNYNRLWNILFRRTFGCGYAAPSESVSKKTVSILSKKISAFSVAKKSAFYSFFLLTMFDNILKYTYISQQANINRQ